MKTVEVHLGYFKQGDDLQSCIEEEGNNAKALYLLAERLEGVVKHIDSISSVFTSKTHIDICADTHYIAITCEDEVAQKLVDEGLAYFPEYDEEDGL